jgi:hypothetical protein
MRLANPGARLDMMENKKLYCETRLPSAPIVAIQRVCFLSTDKNIPACPQNIIGYIRILI